MITITPLDTPVESTILALPIPTAEIVDAGVRPRTAKRAERPDVPPTRQTLDAVIAADEDFEWYPTTDEMIQIVMQHVPRECESVLDIGAGDGRVLLAIDKHYRTAKGSREFSKALEFNQHKGKPNEELLKLRDQMIRDARGPRLLAIEKSTQLLQAQPEHVVPVGTDFVEQDLSALKTDFVFCNPPYSQFEHWMHQIISTGYARRAVMIVPRRWSESGLIKDALKRREATAKVVHSTDFHNAERQARAVVDIVRIDFKCDWRGGFGGGEHEPRDPFVQWFNENVDNMDKPEPIEEPSAGSDLEKAKKLDTISGMVEAYNADYARLERNYKAIFSLDSAIIQELGIQKDKVREGLKQKMVDLKAHYWKVLFDRLDSITSRLSTATKERFMKRLTGRTAVAFTASNAYAIVLWSIKHANRYFNEQLITLFRSLSTHDGVMNYKSNQRTWGSDQWRYCHHNHHDSEQHRPTHYALDYRIVREGWLGIHWEGTGSWENPGGLKKAGHELIADIRAVLGNLGFTIQCESANEQGELRREGKTVDERALSSRDRQWESNVWQDFIGTDGKVMVQVKAFKNGNLHMRFRQEAIKALNIEAGRLLGWIKDKKDVVAQLGYSSADADRYFRSSQLILPSSIKLLGAA